jgi:hypothetical protein
MTRAARLEGGVQVGIMLIMGVTAAAASFTHIHDLTVANGQPGWIGWANAVCVELMSIASGLELRRRKRTRQPAVFVYFILFAAVVVSLAAQVARAKPSVWGWIVAALPALAFLAIVKIVLTRTAVTAEPVRTEVMSEPAEIGAEDAGPVETLDRSTDRDVSPAGSADRSEHEERREVDPAGSSHAEQTRSEMVDGSAEIERWDVDQATENLIVPAQRINGNHDARSQTDPTGEETLSPRSGRSPTRTGPDRSGPDGGSSGPDRARRDSDVSGLYRNGQDDELRELGLTIATRVAMRNGKLTREVLINEIRGEGRTIGTDRASTLLAWIKEETDKTSVGAT